MASSPKKLLPRLVTAVPALIITGSGVAKLAGVPQVRAAIANVHMTPYLPVLGLLELAFTALFLYPQTRKLGFLLLSCYFAGAIAADLSHGASPVPAAVILSLVWVAAFLRDRGIFLPSARTAAPG